MSDRPSMCKPLIYSIIFAYVSMAAIVDVMIFPIEKSEASTPIHNPDKEQNRADENAPKREHEQASINLPVLASKTASTRKNDGNMSHAKQLADAASGQLPDAINSAHERWQINIASLANKAQANSFVKDARTKGINATYQLLSINGKKYWRVSVKGFLSSNEARSYAIGLKKLLGLKEYWISNESDQSKTDNIANSDNEKKDQEGAA